jgi:hypothetical protein
MAGNNGSVILGAVWMVLLSLLLCWLPLLGPLLAGIVGGKTAGGVGGALLAALLPSIILGVTLFVLATTLTGFPIIGVVAGMGGMVLALAGIGPLLLGALIGGLLA